MVKDVDFEDDEFLAQAEEETEEEDLVEDDEMTSAEDGFLRGYNEEAELDEAEEEELFLYYRYFYLCHFNTTTIYSRVY